MEKQLHHKSEKHVFIDPKIQFSIIIPCYNQAHYLKECLSSIVAQTLTNWEAIIVDDASSEGDINSIICNFSDERFRIIRHQKNRGLAAARNTGISEGSGDIIVLLDADDRLSPSYLAEINTAFIDESIGFAYTDVKLFGDKNGIWKYKPFQIIDWANGQPMLGCNPFRRSIWNDIGGFSEAEELRIGNEDYDFWMAVVAAGYRGVHIPIPLYEYRRTKNSMMKSLDLSFHETVEYIARRHFAFLTRNSILNSFLSYGYQRSALNIFRTTCYRDAIPLAQQAMALGSTDKLVMDIANLKRKPRIFWPFNRWVIIATGTLSRYWYLFAHRFLNISKTIKI